MRWFTLAILLLFGAQAFADEAFVSVCERHSSIKTKLMGELGLACEDITAEVLSKATELEVSVKIRELKASDFQGLNNLESLRLKDADNLVGNFPVDLFEYLSSLDNLFIFNARFSSLPYKTFAKLRGLYALGFIDSQVGAISPEFFTPLIGLQNLFAPTDALLNQPYPSLKNLFYLRIHNGDIGHLSETFFESFDKLQFLTLINVRLENAQYNLFSPLKVLMNLTLKDVDLTPFAAKDIAWPNPIKTVAISFDKLPSTLPVGLFDQSPLTAQNIDLRENHNLQHIPDNLFLNINGLTKVVVTGSPLTQTNKSAFNGVIQVFGLPTNFGVTEMGGTSEEWAP